MFDALAAVIELFDFISLQKIIMQTEKKKSSRTDNEIGIFSSADWKIWKISQRKNPKFINYKS